MNLLRSTGNQIMTFGQLIQYNTRNIFIEKPYKNRAEKLFPGPFPNKSN